MCYKQKARQQQHKKCVLHKLTRLFFFLSRSVCNNCQIRDTTQMHKMRPRRAKKKRQPLFFSLPLSLSFFLTNDFNGWFVIKAKPSTIKYFKSFIHENKSSWSRQKWPFQSFRFKRFEIFIFFERIFRKHMSMNFRMEFRNYVTTLIWTIHLFFQ